MVRVKAFVRIEFAEALRPWLDIRALLRAGQGSDSGEVQGEAVIINKPDRHQRISLLVRALSVEQETGPGSELTVEPALETIRMMSAAFPFPDVASVKIEFLAIDPYELPFHELAAQVKRTMLSASPLFAGVTDISVVTDETTGEGIMNHWQIGPMRPAQLNQQYLAFARTDMPEQFLFISVSREEQCRTPLDMGALREEVAACDHWAASVAESIAAAVRD